MKRSREQLRVELLAAAEEKIEALRPAFETIQATLVEYATAVFFANEALDEIEAIAKSETKKASGRAAKDAKTADAKIAKLQKKIAELEALKAALSA